ncbi:MAG: chromate transporter [Bacteroidetes bacterium]|nr:chromate transporter [Bacteroidota bacterium]
MTEPLNQRTKLKELAGIFLKLGTVSFGGPAAHIAMMEKEVVRKRQWMTHEHFLDLIGATNLIPGPNSTEMAIHCGYQRAGRMGLWLAGFSFILPAVLITTIFAWFYKQYGALPAVEPFFYGIKPAVIAIILDAVFKFGKKALKNWQLSIIGIAVVTGALFGASEILLILLAGMVGIICLSGFKKTIKVFSPLVLLQVPVAITSYSTTKLFWVFLKIGSVLFGSGYVLFAYLDGELVQKLHWLTRQQLIDAVAVGQFTPGPVLSSATFIGYQIAGFTGAIVSTIGIFLPSFIFVLLLNPLVSKLRKSKVASAFLDSVNIASVALMLAVTLQMAHITLIDWKTWVIALVGFACLYGIKNINTVWVVVGGAGLGYLFHFISQI